MFSSTKDCVNAEEGFLLQPQKTLEEFDEAEYECLILPGCSQPIYALRDKKLIDFLRKFRDSNYPIGAICSGPLILAKARLLEGRQFITSAFMDLMVRLPFVQEENLCCQPLVQDGPIITALGAAFNEFALAMVAHLGYACPKRIYTGVDENWQKEDYIFYYPEEIREEALQQYQEFF